MPGPPTAVPVKVDADDLVRGKEAVEDALLEAVGVDGLAEVIDVGNVFGFLRRRRQADLRGAGEVIEDFAPGGVRGRAAAVTFIHENKVEKFGRELLVNVLDVLDAGHGLIEGQIDFVGLIDAPVANLVHGRAERLEVVVDRLIDKDVSVGQIEDAFLDA